MADKLDEIFDGFDTDGSGSISCAEVQSCLEMLVEIGYDKAPVSREHCNVTAAVSIT